MIELKPCPFCGSNKLEMEADGGNSAFVTCLNCNAFGPDRMLEEVIELTERENLAAADWNKRASVSNTDLTAMAGVGTCAAEARDVEVCGVKHRIIRCELEPGHEGEHGIEFGKGAWYRWPRLPEAKEY